MSDKPVMLNTPLSCQNLDHIILFIIDNSCRGSMTQFRTDYFLLDYANSFLHNLIMQYGLEKVKESLVRLNILKGDGNVKIS